MPCFKVLGFGLVGFFWWIFLSLLFFLSSPVFLGKPSPHVDVRIALHLCLCEDKFMLLLLWVCPSSSSDVLLSFFPPYCCCPFTPVSFEHVQYGWGWICSLLRNLSDLCFDYFFFPPEMSLHLLFFKDRIGWSDSHQGCVVPQPPFFSLMLPYVSSCFEKMTSNLLRRWCYKDLNT